MPPGTVYVGRPTKWGNPWSINAKGTSRTETVAEAVARYETALAEGSLVVSVAEVRAELAGRDLACWCRPGDPCHADVLIEIAN